MYRFFETLFLSAALMGAEAWFLQGYYAHAPQWDSGLAFLAAVAAILLRDPINSAVKKKVFRHDKKVCSTFLDEFPSNGPAILFLKEHDLGNPFSSDNLKEIDRFVIGCDNAEHEFQSKSLERKRRCLLKSIKDFRSEVAVNTYPDNVQGWLTMDLNDHEERSELLKKRDNLNRLATAVYSAHQDLIKTANKVLREET